MVAGDTRLVLEIHNFSVEGMDNFGGMNNNMDRFGSSGVGRMNGEFPRCFGYKQVGNTWPFSWVFLTV